MITTPLFQHLSVVATVWLLTITSFRQDFNFVHSWTTRSSTHHLSRRVCHSRILSSLPKGQHHSRKPLQLNMIFDFIRQRSLEGIAQVQNIAKKSLEGQLGEALQESADYIQLRQKVDAENLRKLTAGLSKSRDRLLGGISGAFQVDGGIEARLEKLEEVLLQADIGATTTLTIIEDLRSYARTESLQEEDILPVLRARLIEALSPETTTGINFAPVGSNEPTVIFVIGANGMGKTTTIGKIASRLRNEGNLTVLLGACDTFRAAAVEQLGEWALRANVSIEVPLENERGGDPVPVVTRSVQRAIAEKYDVLIIDTSGRLSNNFELTQQLQDMKKAIQKELPSAPHETLLVVDGSVGRNAVDQAAAWRKYVGVSGLVVTKLDGTARGGFVVSVVKDLGFPVKFIGIGEKIEDLKDFEPAVFVDALLGNDDATAKKLFAKAQQMLGMNVAKGPGGVAMKSSGNRMQEAASSSPNDAAARLRASFQQNQVEQPPVEQVAPVVPEKSKRAKRPKPQNSNKNRK